MSLFGSLLVLSVVNACGGRGSSRSDNPPVATLDFPSPNALTDADSILVRGETGGPAKVESATVNGVAATSNDGFVTFEATVPLLVGSNRLTVAVTDVNGRTNPTAATIDLAREGSLTAGPIDVGIEDSRHALLLDATRRALVRIDLATGDRAVVTSDDVGGGPPLVKPEAITVHSQTGMGFVADFGAVVRVDLGSGVRDHVSDDMGRGSGRPLGILSDVTIASGVYLYVASLTSDAILAVNLGTGDRSEVSGINHGAGPMWSEPTGISDWPSGLLVVDRIGDTLLAVDVLTGERTLVSDDAHGTGPSLAGPVRVRWDPVTSRALVTSSDGAALLAVDPATGDRVIVSNADVGSGPAMSDPFGLALVPTVPSALIVDRGGRRTLFRVSLLNGDREPLFDPHAGSGPSFVAPVDFELDPTRDRILVLDAGQDALFAVAKDSGDREILSDNPTGDTTISFRSAYDGALVLDEPNGRVLVPVHQALLAIELATGARSVVSDEHHGSGPSFSDPADLCLDAASGRVFVTNRTPAALFSIEMLSGARTLISDSSTGGGPQFGAEISGAAFDAETARIFVLDASAGRLFAVEPVTGERTVIADSSSAASLVGADAVDLDLGGRIAYVSTLHRVIAIDLATGAASVRSEDGIEAGPWLDLASGLRFDAGSNVLWAVSVPPAALSVIDGTTGVRLFASR
jgi:outer membrane protein assembly factor BamB